MYYDKSEVPEAHANRGMYRRGGRRRCRDRRRAPIAWPGTGCPCGGGNEIIVSDYVVRSLVFSHATIQFELGASVSLTCTGMQSVLSSRYNTPTWVVAHRNSLFPEGECIATNSPFFKITEISTKGPYTDFIGLYADHPEVIVTPGPFTFYGRRWSGEARLIPTVIGEPTGEMVPAALDLGDQGQAVRVETSGEGWELVETITPLTMTADIGGLGDPIHATCPVVRFQQRFRFFVG